MKTYFYYKRSFANKPMVTHAFIIDGDIYARGTAVCSYNDNPCKATGRKIAEERAKQALLTRKSFMNDSPAVKHSHPHKKAFFKGIYMPHSLEAIERKFIENYKNREI